MKWWYELRNLVWSNTTEDNHLLEVIETGVPGSRKLRLVRYKVVIVRVPFFYIIMQMLSVKTD